MLWSVTEGLTILVAMTIAISTDLRSGYAESGGCAAVYMGVDEASGGDERVENMPRQSSGQTFRR